jgi:1-acyl-sn-glycerol-3-phosphate acyltransferase
MMRRVEHGWRLFGTALAFTAFGLGGLLLTLTVFPLLRLLVRDTERRTDLARLAVHHAFRLQRGLMVVFGVIRFAPRDTDCLNADRGSIVIANHPSLLDIVLLISLTKRAQCIVKAEIWRNPFMRSVVIAANYIRNDSDPGQLMAACAASLARGDNLIIFPEGSRTVPGAAQKFQRGVANIALRINAPIRIVTIRCVPSMLRKGQKWYDIPASRPLFRVYGYEKLDPAVFLDNDTAPTIASRRLTCYLSETLKERLLEE